MDIFIIVLIVLAIVTIGCVLLLIHDEHLKQDAARDAQAGKAYSEALEMIYKKIWSGDPADRPTAWFRVIGYLQREHYPEEMIREAQLRKLFEGEKQEVRSKKVNSRGHIIQSTSIYYMIHLN